MTTTRILLALTAALLATALSAQHDAAVSILRGPDYEVRWTDALPEIRWNDELAPKQLTVTAPGLGYLTDASGEPAVLLDWRGGRNVGLDRAYDHGGYFRWGLKEVRKGKPFSYEKTAAEKARDGAPAAFQWTGTRTVRLSNPGHEMVFVVTPDSATATDNGAPLPLSGSDGNYRARGRDFEVGVSVRPNGYVYHYYRPR